MNLNLCKKCRFNKFKEYYFVIYPDGRSELRSRLYTECHIYYKSYEIWSFFNNWHIQYRNNTLNFIINDESAEPSKLCPYYIEHMMENYNM